MNNLLRQVQSRPRTLEDSAMGRVWTWDHRNVFSLFLLAGFFVSTINSLYLDPHHTSCSRMFCLFNPKIFSVCGKKKGRGGRRWVILCALWFSCHFGQVLKQDTNIWPASQKLEGKVSQHPFGDVQVVFKRFIIASLRGRQVLASVTSPPPPQPYFLPLLLTNQHPPTTLSSKRL